MPINVLTFFESFKVFSFSFIPNAFCYLDNENFQKLSVFNKTPLFLMNAGYLITAFIAILILYGIFIMFSKINSPFCLKRFTCLSRRKSMQWMQGFSKKVINNIFEWNVFMEFCMLCVMHLLFAFCIQFFDILEIVTDAIGIVNLGVSILSMIGLVFFFVYTMKVIIKNKQQIMDKQVSQIIFLKYGFLWRKCRCDNFYIQTCFYLHLMLRRVLFTLIISVLQNYAYV